MGSKEFPGEADFDDFLTSHSGSTNAYTECELTNFHFDVAASSLRPVLQRFAAFFKTPLCSESALEREVSTGPVRVLLCTAYPLLSTAVLVDTEML